MWQVDLLVFMLNCIAFVINVKTELKFRLMRIEYPKYTRPMGHYVAWFILSVSVIFNLWSIYTHATMAV